MKKLEDESDAAAMLLDSDAKKRVLEYLIAIDEAKFTSDITTLRAKLEDRTGLNDAQVGMNCNILVHLRPFARKKTDALVKAAREAAQNKQPAGAT